MNIHFVLIFAIRPTVQAYYKSVSKVYSSPLKRCAESANLIYQNKDVIFDNRLLEFNYGEAEGLSYDTLIKHHPEINANWRDGKDPNFPNGENTQDVSVRLNSFMDSLSGIILNDDHPVSIITHNGVIRCLLGNAYGLNLSEWYKSSELILISQCCFLQILENLKYEK